MVCPLDNSCRCLVFKTSDNFISIEVLPINDSNSCRLTFCQALPVDACRKELLVQLLVHLIFRVLDKLGGDFGEGEACVVKVVDVFLAGEGDKVVVEWPEHWNHASQVIFNLLLHITAI